MFYKKEDLQLGGVIAMTNSPQRLQLALVTKLKQPWFQF